MREMGLKEAFNLAKHLYYHKSGNTYIIEKGDEYYCRVKTEKDAQRLTFHLKRIGFKKENLEKALKETNIKRCRKWDRTTNTGFRRTSRIKNNRYRLGYMYSYEYMEDGKHYSIRATNLPKLREKVLIKGLEWYPETDEAKRLEEVMVLECLKKRLVEKN